MAPSKAHKLSDTAFGGRCKVCAEPEEKGKRFLICGNSHCVYKYYHIRCMNPDQIASDAQQGNKYWYCPSCLCRTCLSDMDDDKIIMCDRCDEAHHLYCLNPRLTSVPKGSWYCESCTEAKARVGEVKMYEKRMMKLHRKRNTAMVKSDKFVGADLLFIGAKLLRAEEEEELELKLKEAKLLVKLGEAKLLKPEEAEKLLEAKKLLQREEAKKRLKREEEAIAAEKLGGDEEMASVAEKEDMVSRWICVPYCEFKQHKVSQF